MQRANRAGKVSGEEWARLLAALSLAGMLLQGGQGRAGQARLLADWARCRDAGGGDHGERGGAAGARGGSVCARRGSPSARGLPRTRAAGRGVGTPAAGDCPTAPDATMATDSKCAGPGGGRGTWGGEFFSRARLPLWQARGSSVWVTHLRSGALATLPITPCYQAGQGRPGGPRASQEGCGTWLEGTLDAGDAARVGLTTLWGLDLGPELAFREPSIGAL